MVFIFFHKNVFLTFFILYDTLYWTYHGSMCSSVYVFVHLAKGSLNCLKWIMSNLPRL